MSDAGGPLEPRAAMRLRFVDTVEKQALVSAWEHVERRDDSRAMLREWFSAAMLEDSFRARLWARGLRKLKICRDDGTVDPTVQRVLAARVLSELAGGIRRRRA